MKVPASIACVFALLLVSLHLGAAPPGTRDEISQRLLPAGSICLAGDDCGTTMVSVSTGARSGQDVYDTFCYACHTNGVSAAPIFGDRDAWSSRLDKGADELWQTTLSGINLMPQRGGCANCTDDELRAALDYMLDAVASN